MSGPPTMVVCHACSWRCNEQCYSIHRDKFSCHNRICKYHVGQPYTELKNNIIVPSDQYQGPVEVFIDEDEFQPEPVQLPSNHPIVCMECTDTRCSYGCMEAHRELDDSRYHYCHNTRCVNYRGAVRVNLDEKGGYIHSAAPRGRPPADEQYSSRPQAGSERGQEYRQGQ